jgi:hypothetical protein
MLYFFVFIASFILDFLSANWTKAVVSHKRLRATTITGIYQTIAILNTLIIIKDFWCVIPMVIGRMLGVFIAVTFNKYPKNF